MILVVMRIIKTQQNEKVDSKQDEINHYSNLEPDEVNYDPDKSKNLSKT